MNIAVLILAAGRGTRFGGPVPKVFLPCAGQPVLVHTARRLGKVHPGATMVLAVHPDDEQRFIGPMRDELDGAGVTHIVAGGASRQESMSRALAACPDSTEVVLVHDGARPLFSVSAARDAAAAAAEHGAALLATPCTDTLKRATAERVVAETVDRAHIWRALTPQAIALDVLRRALDHAQATGFEGTDDVSLVEHLGEKVVLIPEPTPNLKITTPQDLAIAEALLLLEASGGGE